jgi:hypothetical protein
VRTSGGSASAVPKRAEWHGSHASKAPGTSDKATGWLFVGVGGLLIAIKETWLLREHYGWSLAAYWPLVVFMIVVSVGNAVVRIAWRRRLTPSDPSPNDG